MLFRQTPILQRTLHLNVDFQGEKIRPDQLIYDVEDPIVHRVILVALTVLGCVKVRINRLKVAAKIAGSVVVTAQLGE